jgi:hypothetical protein
VCWMHQAKTACMFEIGLKSGSTGLTLDMRANVWRTGPEPGRFVRGAGQGG